MKQDAMFKSRKEQIEKDFLRILVRDLKKQNCPLTAKGRTLVRKALRDAAMIGAAEERFRSLRLIRTHGPDFLAGEIVAESVLKVLGYE